MARGVTGRLRRGVLGLAPALLLGLGGCLWQVRPGAAVDAGLTAHLDYATGGATFHLRFSPTDASVIPELERALARAVPRIRPWGAFTTPITLRLYPDHQGLEDAVDRHHYPWLRAWARYDEIFLQSPRRFGIFEGGLANLAELLTHELTHCLMYQLAATRSTWQAEDLQIPIWFREGMASWTARQGPRRMSEAHLAHWIRKTGEDPVDDAPSLYRTESDAVYGAAHWAFSFLVERYGVASVSHLLRAMRRGEGFDEAFTRSVGIPRQAFQAEFLRYLQWDGWQDRRHPAPQAVLRARPGQPLPRPRPAPASP